MEVTVAAVERINGSPQMFTRSLLECSPAAAGTNITNRTTYYTCFTTTSASNTSNVNSSMGGASGIPPLTVAGNPNVKSVSFPSLVDLPGELLSPEESGIDYYSIVVYANPSLEVVNLASLESVGCGLCVSSNAMLKYLSLPALSRLAWHYYGLKVEDNAALESISLPALEVAKASGTYTPGNGVGLSIERNERLLNVAAPNLTKLENGMLIKENAELAALEMSALATIEAHNNLVFEFTDNPKLEVLNFSALTTIREGGNMVSFTDDFDAFQNTIWEDPCAGCSYAKVDGFLAVRGNSQFMRTVSSGSITSITAGFQRRNVGDNHIISLSSSADNFLWGDGGRNPWNGPRQGWEGRVSLGVMQTEGTQESNWEQREVKFLYGQSQSGTTLCEEYGYFEIEIHISATSISFYDSRCGDLSLQDTIGASNVYLYVGADQDDIVYDPSHVWNDWDNAAWEFSALWGWMSVNYGEGSNKTLANVTFAPAVPFDGTASSMKLYIRLAVKAWCDDAAAAEETYGHIKDWDTSEVTSMAHLFSSDTWQGGACATVASFNEDLSQWNTKSATSMGYMFDGASSFNSDISNFDTSRVADMSSMFSGASSFNSDISNFDTSRVTDMNYMFSGASSFNRDLSNFDTSRVTNMYDMFAGASSFNSDISNFDTSRVTNMYGMFYDASSFNIDVSNFDISQQSTWSMGLMFYGASSFDQVLCWDMAALGVSTNNMFKFSSGSVDPACQSTRRLQAPHSPASNDAHLEKQVESRERRRLTGSSADYWYNTYQYNFYFYESSYAYGADEYRNTNITVLGKFHVAYNENLAMISMPNLKHFVIGEAFDIHENSALIDIDFGNISVIAASQARIYNNARFCQSKVDALCRKFSEGCQSSYGNDDTC